MQTIYWTSCSSCSLDTGVINNTDNICGCCRAVGVRGNIKVTWVHWVSEHNRWDWVLGLTPVRGKPNSQPSSQRTAGNLTVGDKLGVGRNVASVSYTFSLETTSEKYNKGITCCCSLHGSTHLSVNIQDCLSVKECWEYFRYVLYWHISVK